MMKNTYKDTMKFVVRESMKGLGKNTRNTVEHEGSLCHIQRHSLPIAAYAFVDKEYPVRIAYSLLNQALQIFVDKTGDAWKQTKSDNNISIPEIKKLFEQFQNPSNVDKLHLAQEKIDETKIILHDNIRKLLERQGDLDQLVDKSKDLSAGAKQFYQTSKKMDKSCCTLI
jgi:synaptobrevin family protein YKT6